MSYMKKVLIICEKLVQMYAEHEEGIISGSITSWFGNAELKGDKKSAARELRKTLEKLRTQSSITYLDKTQETPKSVNVQLDSDDKIYNAAMNVVLSENLKVQEIKKGHSWGKDGDYDKILQIVEHILIKSHGLIKSSELVDLSEAKLNQDPRAIFVGALVEYLIRLELDQLADKHGMSSFFSSYQIGSSYWQLNDLTAQLQKAVRAEITKVNMNYATLKSNANILDQLNCIKPMIKAFQLEEKNIREVESKKSYTRLLGKHSDGRLTTLVNSALDTIEGLTQHRYSQEHIMELLRSQQRNEQNYVQKQLYGRHIMQEFSFGLSDPGLMSDASLGSVSSGNPFIPERYLNQLMTSQTHEPGHISSSSSHEEVSAQFVPPSHMRQHFKSAVDHPTPELQPSDIVEQLSSLVMGSEMGTGELSTSPSPAPITFSMGMDRSVTDQSQSVAPEEAMLPLSELVASGDDTGEPTIVSSQTGALDDANDSELQLPETELSVVTSPRSSTPETL